MHFDPLKVSSNVFTISFKSMNSWTIFPFNLPKELSEQNTSNSIFPFTVARGLWNNLIQPVGQKSSDYNISVPFLCPSKERPYLATSKNGKSNTSNELLSNMKDFISLMGTTQAQSSLCPI